MDLERLFEFAGNHLYLVIIFFVITVLLVKDLLESLLRKYEVVTPLQAVMLVNQEDAEVVDVREPAEWAKGHIISAKLISLGDLEKRLDELKEHKQKPVIVTCQSGTRSPAACKKLIQEGFARVYMLKGGMTAWTDAGLPVTKPKKN